MDSSQRVHRSLLLFSLESWGLLAAAQSYCAPKGGYHVTGRFLVFQFRRAPEAILLLPACAGHDNWAFYIRFVRR